MRKSGAYRGAPLEVCPYEAAGLVEHDLTFNLGEPVRITFRGKTVRGEVLLASADGLSIALVFDEHLGSYTHLMPALWMGDGFVDLIWAEPVTIFRLQQV
jgi:hypothetical protein